MKKAKPEKTYNPPKPRLHHIDSFVLQITDLYGLQNERYIRTRQGYVLVLKINGIDILGYQEDDRNMVMRSFSQAIQLCKLPQKYLFMDVNPDLSEQKEHVSRQLKDTEHPHRRMILERQLRFLDTIETQTSDRNAYLMLFSESLHLLEENANRFMAAMTDTSVSVCEGADLQSLLRILYQFDWRVTPGDENEEAAESAETETE